MDLQHGKPWGRTERAAVWIFLLFSPTRFYLHNSMAFWMLRLRRACEDNWQDGAKRRFIDLMEKALFSQVYNPKPEHHEEDRHDLDNPERVPSMLNVCRTCLGARRDGAQWSWFEHWKVVPSIARRLDDPAEYPGFVGMPTAAAMLGRPGRAASLEVMVDEYRALSPEHRLEPQQDLDPIGRPYNFSMYGAITERTVARLVAGPTSNEWRDFIALSASIARSYQWDATG